MKNLVKIGVFSMGLFGLVACAQEQTAICTTDNGDGTEDISEFKAKGDELIEAETFYVTNYETWGISKEEAISRAEESTKEFQDVQGLEYTYTADETAISETFTYDYAEENWASLKTAGFDAPSSNSYLSLEKTVEDHENNNYVCEIQ